MRVMMPGMSWWVKTGACALFILALGVAAAWSSSEVQAADYGATVIYFYPSDSQPDQQRIEQIDPAVADVEQWYGTQVGKTFAVSPTVVMKGDHDSGWYKCSPASCDWAAIWYNVLTELRSKGYRICQDETLIIFLASAIPFQGGGSCGAPYSADVGGVAMYTETLLDPILGKPPTDPVNCPLGSWCYSPDASRGVIAHELGHAFTLPHPKGCGTTWPEYCSQTVMWEWWRYPNVSLLDLKEAPEISTLANSPFFSGISGGTSDGGSGDTGSEPDTAAPTVNIVSPSEDAVVRGRWLRVRAESADNVRVAEMELYVDSQLVFTTRAASLDYRWDMRETARGSSLEVTVKALDEAGNAGVAQVRVSR